MTTNLIDTTFAGKNISSAVSVYEYTVLATGTIRIQVRLAAVAGGGDYVAHLTLNDGDVQSDDVIAPRTTYTAAAGETAFWFASMSLDVLAGDVINVFIKGLAGDINESGSIRIFSDNYAVVSDIPTAIAIDALLTANHGTGSWSGLGIGSVSWPVTVTDPALIPLDGVDVWISTDAAGANIVARGYTDVTGTITFQLDPATYYVWKSLSGYSFTNPQTMTVV